MASSIDAQALGTGIYAQAQPTLSYGNSGPAVTDLQNDLIQLGYSVGSTGADGVFGAATQVALTNFQSDNFVASTPGVADQLTWNALAASSLGYDALPSAADFAATNMQTNIVKTGVQTATQAATKAAIAVNSVLPNTAAPGTPNQVSLPFVIGIGVAGLGGVIVLVGLLWKRKPKGVST